MLKTRPPLTVLLVLQFIAIFIYPPSFFQSAPQAWVLPVLVLFAPYLLALIAMNTGALTPVTGRTSLIFIQGINIVVRLMITFPNLHNAAGDWNILLLLAHGIGMLLSWYTITQIERYPTAALLLRQPE